MSQPESVWADEEEEVLYADEADGEMEYEEADEDEARRRFLFFQAAPAWLVSTLVHVLILLILGLFTIANPVKIINVLTASATAEDGPEIEEFAIDDSEPQEMEEETEEVTEPVEITEPVEMTEPVTMDMPMDVAMVPIEMTDFAADMAPTSPSLSSLSSASAKPMGSRSTDMKKKLLREYGGTESSEAAVQEALKWFARHQMPNGGWTLAHNLVCNNRCGNGCKTEKRAKQLNAATSLALLPFLGAGQTHQQGEFRKRVYMGLQFLMTRGKRAKGGRVDGSSMIDYRGEGGNMYDHGLVTIVLCEAYAMTGDPDIGPFAQEALNFIVSAQCRDGGWRYTPRQADGGDTSVVGWQVMALKSGYMGHLAVPPAAIQGSVMFLNKVQSNGGTTYGYAGPSASFRKGTSSVGLLCRMYTGWKKDHSAIVGGVEKIAGYGPSMGSDLYYDYYATQVLRQFGGEHWDNFNVKLRDFLVEKQSQDAGAKGSWWFTEKGHANEAGRHYQTAMATMILEVYYRHMPLYAEAAAEDDFPL